MVKLIPNRLCKKCFNPTIENRIHCKDCIAKINAVRHKRLYIKRTTSRNCLRCNAQLELNILNVYCKTCLEKQNEEGKTINAKIKENILSYYGKVCACCNEDQKEFLQVDHINNDGAEHRKKIGKSGLYRWLIKNNYPKDFQILCANCNFAKGMYGECPHQKQIKKLLNFCVQTN